MKKINLLDTYPKSNRTINLRTSVTNEERETAKKFGKEYFDGDRKIGYGGYIYDGRWLSVAKRFQDFYSLNSDSKILEIGCAKGFLLYEFTKIIPGVKVSGIDVSEYAIENSMPEIKSELHIASAKSVPFKDKSYNLVFSINTLHNMKLPDVKLALKELERLSTSHKYVMVVAYNNEQEKERISTWGLTVETILSCDEWLEIFKEVNYTGDYFWFIP